MIEKEFGAKALSYCEEVNDCAKRNGRVDFIEVRDTKVYGYCMDDEANNLFENKAFLDDQIVVASKIMLIANRWFNAKIDVDDIPVLIGDKNG
jgi:predicted nucleotidyltransferase